MGKNWKTTSAGLTMVIGGVVGFYFAQHPVNETVVMSCVTAVLGGIGLLFAKDNNVTGGTTQQ